MKQPNILIVDDDKSLCEGLVKLLKQSGFKASYSLSGKEGLKKIKRRQFDVVLLDIKMPGIDGMECLSEIKRLSSRVEVIIITGYPSVDTAVDGLKNKAFDYVKKPFEPKQLISIINRATEKLGFIKDIQTQINQKVGISVKERRQEKEWTIKDLSEKTGLSRGLISQIENGKSAPSLLTLRKISKALEVSISELVVGI